MNRNRYANAGPQLTMPEIIPTDDVVVIMDEEEICYDGPDMEWDDDAEADYVYG